MERIKTSAILKKALLILDGGKKWAKGPRQRPEKFCLGNACFAAADAQSGSAPAGDAAIRAYRAIARALGSRKPIDKCVDVVNAWNDAKERRFKHIERVVWKAIVACERAEAV